MTISAQDVSRLLTADDPHAVLVLIEGRTEVVGASELNSDDYRGALQITTREDLLKQTGGRRLSERDLQEHADNLDVAVRDLGG
ncbi:MAG: hypothetical protein WAM92_05050 [Mycobacterium sp.]